ncbi:MAG: phosphoribosylformylglycinamidine synthase subunit PurS [Acidobacteria bacterium]|nr:phosphoribosylformylglycinamidine synthase subunit PurS [Acidobacteriota bacterium]
MKVRVLVSLKPGILDPQGKAVEHGLAELGFEAAQVRIGKLIELEVSAGDAAQARAQVQAMCEKLLVNPVMEKAQVEVLG